MWGGSEFVEPFTLSRLHSVCVLIGIPFWKPVGGSDASRQPLQEDAGLVLMLSNSRRSGAFRTIGETQSAKLDNKLVPSHKLPPPRLKIGLAISAGASIYSGVRALTLG